MAELGEVTKLVAQLKSAEIELESKTEELKKITERVRILKEESIPGAMLELGYQKVDLADGTKIEIKKEVYAHLPEAKREAALAWLDEHGFGSIIKATTTIEFEKGQAALIEEITKLISSYELESSTKRNVHAMTLKAFVKEQLSQGTSFPEELFNIRPVDLAKITEKPKFSLR